MAHNNGLDLQERMKNVRAKRIHRVAELQNEAGRLTDWREYVRSAPITALASSTLLGFIAVQTVTRAAAPASIRRQPELKSSSAPLESGFSTSGYLMSSAIRALTSIALTAGKSYLTQQMNSLSNSSKS
jgi:hypothetical protein